MFRVVSIIATGLLTTVAYAEPQPLASSAIRETFAGSTIALDTPLAATVPIHYLDNGQVTGEAGNLSWILGSATDKGRWWVEKDRLCHKWKTWFEAENQCLRLQQEGDRLFWVRDDGKTGTATLISRPRPPPLQVQPPLKVQTFASMMPMPPPVQAPPFKAGTPSQPQPAAALVARPAPLQAAALVLAQKPKTALPKKPATGSRLPAAPPPLKQSVATSSLAFFPTFMVAGVDEDDVLYVRDGPSTDHASIGALSPQAQGVKILGICQQEWCPVALHGVMGWVNTYYLVAESLAATPPSLQLERQSAATPLLKPR